jgi:predicted Zn-dependent protease
MNFIIPVTFLRFSRHDEAEADYLGLQYMYKTGYDPNAFVAFFEKVQTEDRKQPGTIPKIFSTHPPTPERIEASQKEIAKILPSRDEYIVTTSEFDAVKHRLQMIHASLRVKDSKGPSLRKRTDQNKGGTTNPGDTTASPTSTGSDQTTSDGDRPTLKRRPDDQQP